MFEGHFSLGCHFHVHFSNPWHAFASHGLSAIAELLVFIFTRATPTVYAIQHVYATAIPSDPLHVFGSSQGFSRSADRMAHFQFDKIQDDGRRPSLIYKSGHNFATGLPIDVMFGFRVGFRDKLIDRRNLHTSTVVARNPCVS